jgi:hypothetical protein
MMLNRKLYFFLLFPLSSVFWWFFEYLNRYVQNWYYTEIFLGASEYFLYATISFSTVLPAVLSTREWLLSYSFVNDRFRSSIAIKLPKPKYFAWFTLIISGAGLAFIGVWPDYLFPIVWISPVLIVVSLQVIGDKEHIFSALAVGNWTMIISSSLAAFICGFFWEMWNYWSLTKWEYGIPLVHRFQIFEMPLLGYAGYLPFGLECALAGSIPDHILRDTPHK